MDAPDLTILETVLLDLSKSSLASFADEHRDEVFYAFGFDCNADYGDVLLCLNTESDFAKTSQEYIAKWSYGPKELAELRRNFGDWKYQGFNCEQSVWIEAWKPHADAIERYLFSDELAEEDREIFIEDFLLMVCRVLVHLERSGALAKLPKDAGFFTQVMDHDEDLESAEGRLEIVRAEMAG